jgi:hypothetical protein
VAAETLFVITENEELRAYDWSQSTKNLKEAVEKIKKAGV